MNRLNRLRTSCGDCRSAFMSRSGVMTSTCGSWPELSSASCSVAAGEVLRAEAVGEVCAEPPVEVPQAGPERLAHLPAEAAQRRDVADVTVVLCRVRADDQLREQRLAGTGRDGDEQPGRRRVERTERRVGDEAALRRPERQDWLPVEGERLLHGCGEVGWKHRPDAAFASPSARASRCPATQRVSRSLRPTSASDDESRWPRAASSASVLPSRRYWTRSATAAQEPLRRAEHGAVEAVELGAARQRGRGGRPRAQVPVERGHVEAEEQDSGVQRDVCALGELGRLGQSVTELAVDGAGVRALVGAVVPDLRGERGGQPVAACFGRVFQEEVEDVGADGERAAALLELGTGSLRRSRRCRAGTRRSVAAVRGRRGTRCR